jgi:quercetin dioxygenase-like cupin family protein
MQPKNIMVHPIHLGLGATATAEPEFTGDPAWYEDYMTRHVADGAEARIVAMHTFSASWPMWEMHPEGSEVLLCTTGAITLHQEHPDGQSETVTLGPGEYAINEAGVWHTADVESEATALFITAGKGTQHRPR